MTLVTVPPKPLWSRLFSAVHRWAGTPPTTELAIELERHPYRRGGDFAAHPPQVPPTQAVTQQTESPEGGTR